MSLTTNPNEPCLCVIEPSGQQKCYLILSEEERAKGFVMPVHRSYTHLKCGSVTTMGLELCETYARNPTFYGGTFCCFCRAHFPLRTAEGWQFLWPDRTPVGCTPEEAQAILSEAANRKAEIQKGAGI